MPGFVPGIHVFKMRGWPGQARLETPCPGSDSRDSAALRNPVRSVEDSTSRRMGTRFSDESTKVRRVTRVTAADWLIKICAPQRQGPRRPPTASGRTCSGHLFLKSHRFLGFPTGEKVDVSPIVRQMSPPHNRDSRLASHGEDS